MFLWICQNMTIHRGWQLLWTADGFTTLSLDNESVPEQWRPIEPNYRYLVPPVAASTTHIIDFDSTREGIYSFVGCLDVSSGLEAKVFKQF